MDSDRALEIALPESAKGEHIRATRALLGRTKRVAARECGVGVNTIGRLEGGATSLGSRTIADIVRTFEANGVVFVRCNRGLGVLLKSGE
ncbi:helix-turn-helix transcriptional regulator [Mesorhizobium sp. M0053]|uniref:helix-turn-helix transcriptional regulator n=1 Tax=Mesorhizobium sp. M0053 TaxID=2956864 RepID=UPI00333D5E11